MSNFDDIENLLELNDVKYVIDDVDGLWVKFEASITPSSVRSNGVRYSLSLHDKHGNRILGFDNAHEIEYGAKRMVAPKRTFDHWHFDEQDKGRPYNYINAGRLIEDFWVEVEKRVNFLNEDNR